MSAHILLNLLNVLRKREKNARLANEDRKYCRAH